jgi:hypothetical protein
MALRRIPYTFSMTLPAPREWVYRWATDYRPADFELLGLRAHRRVERLADDLVLLTDSFDADPFSARPGGRTVKEKLVHLYPEHWSWVSTHLSGPAKGSQFLYELSSRGSRSTRIRYTGAQVERGSGRSSPATVARRAKELREEDSRLWRNLARAMAREYRSRGKRPVRRPRRED